MWTSFVGFMGSGKSTVTGILCRMTGRPLADSDKLVAAAAGRPVAGIFAAEGEAAFRARERAALEELDPARPLVVDTGGGVVESPELVELLRERGVVLWLDAPWSVLRERLGAADEADKRPLVAELGWPGVEQLHRRRRRLYAQAADFRLRADGGSAADLARMASMRSLLWQRRHGARGR